jgi:uncharacterized protein (TIGR03067 family)
LPEADRRDAERSTVPREEAKPDDKTPAKPSDKERLQGLWRPVKPIVNGKTSKLNDKTVRNTILIFDDDMAAVWDGKGPFTLKPDAMPKQLDIELHRKDQKELVKAIYRFEGDRLVVSWMKGTGERPPDFETGKEKGVLIIYEKRKEKAKP